MSKLTLQKSKKLYSTLELLAKSPVEYRTISNLYTSINDRDLKEALSPYKVGGPLAKYFDADKENLKFSNWEVLK